MADYPTTVPNLIDLVGDAEGIDHPEWVEFLENLGALFSGVGAQPGVLVDRVTALESTLSLFGSGGYRNLRIDVASNTTVTVTADWITVEGQLVQSLNVTLDVTVTGALGTASARAIDKWFYIWVGVNPTTGAATGLLDDASTRSTLDTSDASLDGYDKWFRVGSVRTNGTGSGNFIRMHQEGARLLYAAYDDSPAAASVDATVGSGSPTTVTLAHVPPVAARVQVGVDSALNVVSATRLHIRKKGDSGNGVPVLIIPNVLFFTPANTGAASAGTAHTHPLTGTSAANVVGWGAAEVFVNTSQQIEAWWSNTAGASATNNTAVFYTMGYHDTFAQ